MSTIILKIYIKRFFLKNSVALCIRFYEETKNPTIYAFEGRETQVSQFNKVIKEIEKKLINPHFFIFFKIIINS